MRACKVQRAKCKVQSKVQSAKCATLRPSPSSRSRARARARARVLRTLLATTGCELSYKNTFV
ncbi:hypothetical protein Hanom_Chr06g00492011 [Helianthus anomalus]